MMQASHASPYAQSHNYSVLIKGWRSLSKRKGFRLKKILESGGHPLYEISSTVRNPKQCLYISAGIHGDEPAGVWGLFDWFEKNIEQLTDVNFLVYPCLNPWGLLNNTRTDFEGRDMNRAWSDNSHPVIGNVIERLAGAHFRFAINLHEDFDADGIYLYDPPAGKKMDNLAQAILLSGSKYIPVDSRKKIEGRWARNGIIRPSKSSLPKEGLPEAAFLQELQSDRTFVFETPSEYDFKTRVLAQVAMLDRVLEECI